jgi:hypothetical protein
LVAFAILLKSPGTGRPRAKVGAIWTGNGSLPKIDRSYYTITADQRLFLLLYKSHITTIHIHMTIPLVWFLDHFCSTDPLVLVLVPECWVVVGVPFD